MNNYIIGNGVVTDGMDLFIEDGAILVEDGIIRKIGRTAEIKPLAAEFIDVKGRLILPGLTNPHHHLYSYLSVGLVPIAPTPNFIKILENFWWHLDKKLTAESVYFSALMSLIESVKFGVTTIFDHHASMNYVRGSLDKIASVYELADLQGVLCFETSDRMGDSEVLSHVEENINFYNSHLNSENLHGMFGLHANLTLSNKTLEKIVNLKPAKMSVHAHCGEDRSDLEYCLKQGFQGPIDRLNKFGLIAPESLLIHCIHVSDADVDILQRLQPFVVTNPESNVNNRVGRMDRTKVKDFMLGTDGMTGDMVGTLRSHYLLGEGVQEDFSELKRTFFENTQKLRKQFFPKSAGFEIGSRADIAVLNYQPITPINLNNLIGHLIFGNKGSKVFMTISNGKILWADSEIKFIDENSAISEAQKVARNLHSCFQKFNLD